MNKFREKRLDHPFAYAVFTWLFGHELILRMRIISKEQQEQKEPCNVTMKLNQWVTDSIIYKLLVEPIYVVIFSTDD